MQARKAKASMMRMVTCMWKKRHKVHYITDLLAILEVFKGAFTSVGQFICSKTGITIITMLLFILGEVRFHTAKFHTDQIC